MHGDGSLKMFQCAGSFVYLKPRNWPSGPSCRRNLNPPLPPLPPLPPPHTRHLLLPLQELKASLNHEFRLIHELCVFVLTNTRKVELIRGG